MDLEMPLEEADLVDQLHRHSKTRISTSSMSQRCHGTIIVRKFLGIFANYKYRHRRSTRAGTSAYSYKHLRKTVPTHLKIDEVITGASLSTRTSTTTESITLLNPGINLEKYEHPYQVEDLNLGVDRFHHKEPNKLS
jgi:hypothetical protein